jgi:hypothetical protein
VTTIAKHDDFYGVFEQDMKPLYMLAFVLTANHKESEQCFVSTVDEAFKEQTVFKEWVRSWVKRRLIENAIENVSCVTVRDRPKCGLVAFPHHRRASGRLRIDHGKTGSLGTYRRSGEHD